MPVMSKSLLRVFMVFTVFANLVLAADWHPPVSGMGAEPWFEVHRPHRHQEPPRSMLPSQGPASEALLVSDNARVFPEQPDDPHGCAQHACHAHSHLFSVSNGAYGTANAEVNRWRNEQLPLPPQHLVSPDLPPPIA